MNLRVDAALAHWVYVAPLLKPAKNKTQYLALVEALDAVLDAGGADESDPLEVLAAMLGDLVSAYEKKHYPMPKAMSAIEALRWFMARDGLRQSDLPEIGNQAKVSEILSGRRALNLRQARALAERFSVSIEMFSDK
ncbi:MAG: transcriptional regulator [Betaproteobacteria bacterium]|nr:transcriptional regulator [Betaproteobacteria bacterium]